MQKKHYGIFTIIFIFYFFNLIAVEMVITQPGQYMLGGNLNLTPAAPDTIITISASDVTLDLGGYIIAQTNALANVDGIQIFNAINNVTIKNGTIRGPSRFGIASGSNSFNINIENINFENCGLRAISVDGLTDATVNKGISIVGCRFFNCCETSTTGTIIHIGFSRSVQLNDNWIGRTLNSQPNAFITAMTFTAVRQCNLDGMKVSELSAPIVTIFDFSGINGSSFENIRIENNSATTSNFVGLLIRRYLFGANTSFFKNILITQNSSLGNFDAFSLIDSQACVYNTINIIQNTATSLFTGFNILPSVNSTNNANVFTNCTIVGNRSTGVNGLSRGFLIQATLNNSFIQNSIVAGNFTTGSGGIAAGIDITATTGNCNIINNYIVRNRGVSVANSFGIRVPATNTGNLFSQNISYANGSTANNQLFNVPARTTPTAPATSNIGATSNPYWSNFQIAS